MKAEKFEMEYEKILSTYYSDDKVRCIIALNVETKSADDIASKIAELEKVDEVFLVTGDVDILVKATFDTYQEMKDFILSSIADFEGIKNTKTMMIVTSYKGRKS